MADCTAAKNEKKGRQTMRLVLKFLKPHWKPSFVSTSLSWSYTGSAVEESAPGHLQIGDITAVIEYAMMVLFFLMMAQMVILTLPRALECCE